jgi:alpha-N-arabinofuranosidase
LLKSTITIDARARGREVDRRIYGHFIENMARCTYGGILRNTRPGNPAGPWERNERVVELIKELDPPVVRWPGGLYADGYHFRDGIGPVAGRPLKRNRYWSRYGPALGFFDPFAFGSDEFMRLVADIGAQPYVNVNFGTGTATEAASWVGYMNATTDRVEGRQRAGYGHQEPWGVKTWGIGNEAYGLWSLCRMSASDYVDRYLDFKAAMSEADPGLEYVAVGADHYFNRSWNREVLQRAADEIDLLSIHVYLPGPERIAGVMAARAIGGSARMYGAIVASPIEYERRLRQAIKDIEDVAGEDSKVGIAFDEWNLWWTVQQLQFPRWTLRDALFACGVFHAMNRLSGRVRMANIAQIVNVLGVISTLGDRVCRTALYYPFLMYAKLAGPEALEVRCVTGSVETPRLGGIPAMTNVPLMDCLATRSGNGDSITLFTINRHPTDALLCRVELAGASPAGTVRVVTLDGPDVNALNTYRDDEVVSLRERQVEVGDVLCDFSFPAHSVTAMVFEVPST